MDDSQSAGSPVPHGPTASGDPHEETVTLKLTPQQLQMIKDAVQYYRENKCPLDGNGEWCCLLTWGENVHTGAIELSCLIDCDAWGRSLGSRPADAEPH